MSLRVCHICNTHFLSTSLQCPTCVSKKQSVKRGVTLAILMGLGMMGCGEKNQDTGAEDTAQETSSEPEPSSEDLYGVHQNRDAKKGISLPRKG